MTELTTTLLLLAVLFALFLVARAIGVRVCAACAAASTTWLLLLALLYVGWSVDPLLIGILMGGSVIGVMYLLQEKLPKVYHLFTFPFMVTLFAFVYLLLADIQSDGSAYLLLAVLWAVFAAIFVARSINSLKGIAKKLIECCKNW